jgi:hypothetical protein
LLNVPVDFKNIEPLHQIPAGVDMSYSKGNVNNLEKLKVEKERRQNSEVKIRKLEDRRVEKKTPAIMRGGL